MHEFGVTETIVNRLLRQIERDQVAKVVRITFRRSSAFSEEVLRQTFDVLSVGTPLAEAELVVEIAVLRVDCVCGLSSEVYSEGLVGHMFICPSCSAIREIAEAHDLELVEVIAETEGSPDGIQA
jgi:Zn finger protein HypA/HybF involved in hydrogenase expression